MMDAHALWSHSGHLVRSSHFTHCCVGVVASLKHWDARGFGDDRYAWVLFAPNNLGPMPTFLSYHVLIKRTALAIACLPNCGYLEATPVANIEMEFAENSEVTPKIRTARSDLS